MSSRFLIYALIDPRTGRVRYVGQSSTGMTRPRTHVWFAKSGGRTYCDNWVRQLLKLGMMFDVWVLEELEAVDSLDAREVWWIAFARAWGCPLTNLTDGGGGIRGYSHTDEARERIRNIQKTVAQQRRADPVAYAAWLSKERSNEHRQRVSDGTRAAYENPVVHEKATAAIRTRMANPEHRAQISASTRRTYEDPEVRKRVGVAVREAMTPARCARRSELRRIDWARRRATIGIEEINRRAGEVANRPEVREKKKMTMRARTVLRVQWGPL
jgi:hypothetical protein